MIKEHDYFYYDPYNLENQYFFLINRNDVILLKYLVTIFRLKSFPHPKCLAQVGPSDVFLRSTLGTARKSIKKIENLRYYYCIQSGTLNFL